jgi:hypothetical protein
MDRTLLELSVKQLVDAAEADNRKTVLALICDNFVGWFWHNDLTPAQTEASTKQFMIFGGHLALREWLTGKNMRLVDAAMYILNYALSYKVVDDMTRFFAMDMKSLDAFVTYLGPAGARDMYASCTWQLHIAAFHITRRTCALSSPAKSQHPPSEIFANVA